MNTTVNNFCMNFIWTLGLHGLVFIFSFPTGTVRWKTDGLDVVTWTTWGQMRVQLCVRTSSTASGASQGRPYTTQSRPYIQVGALPNLELLNRAQTVATVQNRSMCVLIQSCVTENFVFNSGTDMGNHVPQKSLWGQNVVKTAQKWPISVSCFYGRFFVGRINFYSAFEELAKPVWSAWKRSTNFLYPYLVVSVPKTHYTSLVGDILLWSRFSEHTIIQKTSS